MDINYMKRAIELAKMGEGYTRPNPLVGAVIVKDNRIIGEGYHEYFGGPHAEINAINNSIENIEGSTMYVTLEPCSHYGKTPPCVNAIIKSKISKVIVGMNDPNPLVAGKGINILKENGIQVISSVLTEEIEELNEIYIKYITTKMPFCILKTAMTLDGKISTVTGNSKWITNSQSREHVHKVRHKVSAILAGIGTVLKDNPSLNTRLPNKEGIDPIRIIIDTALRIPLQSNVINIESKAKTIIATTKKGDKEKIEILKSKGAQVITTPLKKNKVDIKFLIEKLGHIGIDSILIEGGSAINFSFLNEGLIDKVMFFISPKIIGGENAKSPIGGEGIRNIKDAILLDKMKLKQFKEDILIEGYLRKEE